MFGSQIHTGKRILLVEDHPESVELMQMILEGEGYRVQTVESGRRALQVVASAFANQDPDFRHDLILLDLRLPDMNGVDVVLEMQKDHSVIPPVIFMSADPQNSLEEAARSVGAMAVRKPFDFDDLLKTIERVLDQSASA
jgi:CheY-like chemotaxis protein